MWLFVVKPYIRAKRCDATATGRCVIYNYIVGKSLHWALSRVFVLSQSLPHADGATHSFLFRGKLS